MGDAEQTTKRNQHDHVICLGRARITLQFFEIANKSRGHVDFRLSSAFSTFVLPPFHHQVPPNTKGPQHPSPTQWQSLDSGMGMEDSRHLCLESLVCFFFFTFFYFVY